MVREAWSGSGSGSGSGGGGDENHEMEMGMGMGMDQPAWLRGLMGETFFGGCGVHENRRKNEKNFFCLHCCLSICPHCLPSHSSDHHSLLQVRRYVYYDVVRLGDLEKLIDCSLIQPYTINSAKVIFLNQRPQSRSCKGPANLCFTCERILQEEFHFCSLYCKVHFMQGQDLTSIIIHNNAEQPHHHHHFALSDFEGLRMGDGSEFMAITDDEEEGRSSREEPPPPPHPHPEGKKKKKKGSGSFLPGIVLSLGSRRKGAPHRAPFS